MPLWPLLPCIPLLRQSVFLFLGNFHTPISQYLNRLRFSKFQQYWCQMPSLFDTRCNAPTIARLHLLHRGWTTFLSRTPFIITDSDNCEPSCRNAHRNTGTTTEAQHPALPCHHACTPRYNLVFFSWTFSHCPCLSENFHSFISAIAIKSSACALSKHFRQYGWLLMSGSIQGQNATACAFLHRQHLQSDALICFVSLILSPRPKS